MNRCDFQRLSRLRVKEAKISVDYRERTNRLRKEETDFFNKIAPISEYGNVIEIAGLFSSANQLKEAVVQIQPLLYAA